MSLHMGFWVHHCLSQISLSQCRESNCTAVDGASYHRSMRLGLILNRSIKDSNLRSGKIIVFASCPTHPEQNWLSNICCKENCWCESVTILPKLYIVKFYLSSSSSSNLDFLSFILMAVSGNSFRLLYMYLYTFFRILKLELPLTPVQNQLWESSSARGSLWILSLIFLIK